MIITVVLAEYIQNRIDYLIITFRITNRLTNNCNTHKKLSITLIYLEECIFFLCQYAPKVFLFFVVAFCTFYDFHFSHQFVPTVLTSFPRIKIKESQQDIE